MLASFSEQQRQCTLMFDEIDISKLAAYDHKRDQVVGPHGHLQVILLSGIFAEWNLPILFGFDCRVSKDLLFYAIKASEAAGARVAAIVCDQGPNNKRLWNELDVTLEQTSFVNPAATDRYVAVVGNAVHCVAIKICCRFHFRLSCRFLSNAI